jgi:predicted DCC family thiol-disulfide oxidoreductase YuxK
VSDRKCHLILYDGVCGLCSRLNAFVLKRDPTGIFHFAPIQSDVSAAILYRFNRDPKLLDTFYVIKDYRSTSPQLLAKAQAALFVMSQIGGGWRLMSALKLLPNFLLDLGYDLIARYRYRLFGKHDVCQQPTPEQRSRFIGI